MNEDSGDLGHRLSLLQGVPVLFQVPAPELRRLAHRLRTVSVNRGRVIIEQDDAAETLYVIARGRCEVAAFTAAGNRVPVAVLSRGDFFGVEAISPHGRHLTTVVALEACELLLLGHAALQETLAPGSEVRTIVEQLGRQEKVRLEQLVGRAATVQSTRAATITAVYSPKGGAGKTTVALNVAANLAIRRPGEVLLLDLATPFNGAALLAGVIPTQCLAMADRAGTEHLEEALLSSVVHHPGGLLLLAGSLRIEQSELLLPDLVRTAIGLLSAHFTHIVIDLGVALAEMALTVLETASRILLITTRELSSIKDAREFLDLLGGVLGVPDGHVSVVLNNPRPPTRVAVSSVSDHLGRRIDHEIPFGGPRADEASLAGEIISLTDRNSPMARALRTLASGLDTRSR